MMRNLPQRSAKFRSAEQGFTLIEMLVVLTIVAATMAVVPALFVGLSGVRLRAAADDLTQRLREVRSEAMQRGVAMELILDPARRVYRLSNEAAFRPLPDVVQRLDVAPVLLDADRLARVRFFADGSATEGQLWLRHGSRSAGIAIDWLTGRVRRDD